VRLTLTLLLMASALHAQAGVALTPFARQKVRVLLQTQLPCLGCHELAGEGGRSAPSLTTVGERRSAKYIAGIIGDPQGTLPGVAMPKHVMAPQVRDMIAQFLSEGARGAEVAPIKAPPAPATLDGAHLYEKWCASCHGASGKGDGANAKDLPVKPANHTDAATLSKRPDDSLYDVIAAGGLQAGRSPRMPAFGATLSRAEIRSLVAHIRTLCKCQGPGWARSGKP
jgi:mono/diheme cytochrome c family protein